ncbi:MAG: hypothetical protein ACI8S6_003752 [Myxococcota bacterium]|jgi:hypothetical protein
MFFMLMLACTGTDKSVIVDSGGETLPEDTGEPAGETLSVSISASPAIDPLRGGRAEVSIDFTEGATARVSVHDASGEEVALLVEALPDSDAFTWDGEGDDGDVLPPGAYTITAEVTLGDEALVEETTVYSVRIGALSGTLGGERLPLVWHRAAGPGGQWAAPTDAQTFSVDTLEADGQAVDLPEPWSDLNVPPAEDAVGVSWPAGYPYDATPTLSLDLGGDLAGFDGELTVSLDGWLLDGGDAAPGGALSLTRDGTLSDGPMVVEESALLTFRSGDTIVAEQPVPLRMYALLGAHTFDAEGEAYGAWLAAMDPALRAIAGAEPTDAAVLDALVAYIYDDLGLRYDTTYGASAYVSYRQGSWERAHFNFSSFLNRTNGDIINCTDAAAILGGYANMIGADLSYLILNPSFDLNYILAIGGTSFTSCPFGPNGCGFSYHAVTSPDGGQSIYDATLAIDGDGDPGNMPSTEQLVQGVSGDDYQDAIVRRGTPAYHSESKGTIQ